MHLKGLFTLRQDHPLERCYRAVLGQFNTEHRSPHPAELPLTAVQRHLAAHCYGCVWEDAALILCLPRHGVWQSCLTCCATSILGPSPTLLSPNAAPLTSARLHLICTGLDLGSVSTLSIGLGVMVSSGLSSRWTKKPFQSCCELGSIRQ